MLKTRTVLVGWCTLFALALGLGLSAWAQQGGGAKPQPIRITMEELHEVGGVPPNAVIVEGPGFTGPDGLSKMPDYRDSGGPAH